MPYSINKSDPTKSAITVPDMPPGINTVDTSLKLIGKNYPNFGQGIAENFLHLLENFASPFEPANPIQGQLWYDTGSSEATQSKLYVFDGGSWYPTNGVWQQPSPAKPANPKPGDIWVDTNTSQLFITSDGLTWTLVGPSFSGSTLSGAYPTEITDKNGTTQQVILMYLGGSVMEIISKTAFTPLQVIEGFSNIVPGVNISTKTYDSYTPKFNGVANASYTLRQTSPSIEDVSANSFLRNDVDQKINGTLIINKDTGLYIGANNATFGLTKSANNNLFSNLSDGGKVIFQITKDQIPNTLLTLDGGTSPLSVAIGTSAKQTKLTIYGDMLVNQTLTINSTASNTTTYTGNSLVLSGGIGINGSAYINGPTTINSNIKIAGTITASSIIPSNVNASLGSTASQFKNVFSTALGLFDGSTTIYGRLQGSSQSLANRTSFSLGGQLTSNLIVFDGSYAASGESPYTKILNATLTSTAIVGQPIGTSAQSTDAILMATGVGTTATNLVRISKKNFLSDLYGPDSTLYSNSFVDIVPPGSMVVWPGIDSSIPNGWIKCDGTLYPQAGQYVRLFQLIGTIYGGNTTQFAVPNLPGPTTGTNYIIKF